MNVRIAPFQLEGCRCSLRFDPKEIQRVMHEKLNDKIRKKLKHFQNIAGELTIAGRFMEIDEGNFALHFMLAFLGKARLACRARVVRDGCLVLDEPLYVSATCSCFTSGRSQLKYDAQVLADRIVKKTIKALKSARG